MTNPDQIKSIAADFLRLLVTVPELFARWQAETSPAIRAAIVREQLGLAQLSVSDLERMAAYAQPRALEAAKPQALDIPFPMIIELSHTVALGAAA